MKDKKLTIQEVVTLCAVIVFFGVLTYINFCCYRRYVDSDSAAEALLAMRIRGTHHLFPETWYISTDRRTIATAVPAAVFYFITGNAAFSMALSCTLFSIVMGLSLIYMMRGAGASMNASLTALLLLMALPVNPGHIMFESGFPYFMTLLFLFASHYSGYFTFFFLTVGTALRLRHDGERAERKHIVFAAVLCLVAFIYGGAGMRGLQLVTLPFLCFAVLCFLKGTDLFRRKDRVSARELGLSFIMVLCSLGGGVISGAPAVHTGMADPQSVFSNFTTAAITNPLALLGGEKTDSLSSPESFLQLLMWGAVILSVYAFFRLMKEGDENVRAVLLFTLLSFLVTVFILSATTFVRAERYSCMAVLLIVLSLSLVCDLANRRGYERMSFVLTGFFVFYAAMNLLFTYIPAINDTEWDRDSEEVLSWMEDNGYSLGYARDWDADRLMMKTNAAITFGTVTSDLLLDENGDLVASRWLTDMYWYPPELDRDQPCVYVIPNDKAFLDEFDAFLEVHRDAEKAFENDGFVCYVTPGVYVR